MRLGAKPENVMERVALLANLAPTPLLDTQIAFNMARSIMAAAEFGVFEELGKGDRTASDIATACATDPKATKQLLDCLAGIGYANWRGGKYSLPRVLRKWLLRDSPSCVIAKLVFQSTEWDMMAKVADFIRTGKPLDAHGHLSSEQWRSYQDAM